MQEASLPSPDIGAKGYHLRRMAANVISQLEVVAMSYPNGAAPGASKVKAFFDACSYKVALSSAATKLQLVATRGMSPANTAQITLENRRRRTTRSRQFLGYVAPTKIAFIYPSFSGDNGTGSGSGDILLQNAYSLTAAVEGLGGSSGSVPIKFSGVQAKTITPSFDPPVSDLMSPSDFGLSAFNTNSQFYLRPGVEVALNEYIPLGPEGGTVTGEATSASDTASPLQVNATGTLTTSSPYSSRAEKFLPLAIVGYAPVLIRSFAIVGDSIDRYREDTQGDGVASGGWAQRALVGGTNKYPYVMLAISGTTAASWWKINDGKTNSQGRVKIASYANGALVGYGTNDIVAGRTFAQIRDDLIAIWQQMRTLGHTEVWQRLILPRTSADGATIVTGFAPGGIRDQINAFIVGSVGQNGLTGYLDFNTGICEDGANPGFWAAGAQSGDGVHPAPATHAAMAAKATQVLIL